MVITTSPLVKTYTLQEFWNLPEPADHSKLELIKGVLYMTPRPYQTMGVREMWLIDTQERQIEVRSFEVNKSAVFKIGERLRSEVLQKIEIPLALLFTAGTR
jgi:Uma2 family endonuclease